MEKKANLCIVGNICRKSFYQEGYYVSKGPISDYKVLHSVAQKDNLEHAQEHSGYSSTPSTS
jgi:hypothetical protein